MANKLLLPWVYEPESVDENTGEFNRPRIWGTKPDGDPTLLLEFAVPVNLDLVEFILGVVQKKAKKELYP